MLGLQLGIAVASLLIFSVLMYFWPFNESGSKRTLPGALWGGLFPELYYYGLPL